MKCLRPTGLVIVLVTLPLAVHLASLETTSRYSSGENIRFPSENLNNNIDDSNATNISSQIMFNYELEDNFDENFEKNNRTNRKISKLSSKKNYKVPTATVSTSKTKSNTKSVTTSPSIIKSSIIRKNSTLTLNNTQKISFVATKAPITYRVTSKIALPSRTVTAKLPVKLSKSTTPRTQVKSTIRRTGPSNNLSKQSSTTKKPKKKPTIHKIITKWSDDPVGEIKQNWYEEGVPYPNPNPEISSASPDVSLSSLSPITPISSIPLDATNPLSGISPSPQPEITSYSPNYSNVPSNTPDLIDLIPSVPTPAESGVVSDSSPSASNDPTNPLSVFKLDMVPDSTKSGLDSPCPSVHISSQVLSPLQRQGCSDLNLVINSHIHQNTDNRNPISTYDGLPPTGIAEDELLAEPIAEDAFADGVAADPIAADAPLADAALADPVANAPAAASGGTGGSGGSGGNGSGGPWQFPDLKHMFEALGYVWNGIGYLLGFLRNPYLYIIPFVLFFLLSFFKVLALFPWWIPVLILYVSVKQYYTQPKDEITFTKHIHKPIRHHDGWFWNHQTKRWQNVAHFPYTKRIDDQNNLKMITHLPQSVHSGTSLKTWKRRKRP